VLRTEESRKKEAYAIDVRRRQVEDNTRRRVDALREETAWAECEAFEGLKATMQARHTHTSQPGAVAGRRRPISAPCAALQSHQIAPRDRSSGRVHARMCMPSRLDLINDEDSDGSPGHLPGHVRPHL
jgi:hypothetical protein